MPKINLKKLPIGSFLTKLIWLLDINTKICDKLSHIFKYGNYSNIYLLYVAY